jgi:hypothetical protein
MARKQLMKLLPLIALNCQIENKRRLRHVGMRRVKLRLRRLVSSTQRPLHKRQLLLLPPITFAYVGRQTGKEFFYGRA